jgi:hypothetical protein
VPRPADANADHPGGTVERTPLALDTGDLRAQIEQQVIAAMLRDGPEHVDAELDCLEGDCRLSDVALVVGGEHLPMLAR